MKTGELARRRKRITRMLAGIAAVAVFLAASAFSEAVRSEEMASYGTLLSVVEAQEPPDLLKGFVFIPGAALVIEDHHVLALYKNPQNGFYALALFSTECGVTRCALGELIAYSIVDGEGQAIKLANAIPPEGDRIAQRRV